jgi:hypothetical protein
LSNSPALSDKPIPDSWQTFDTKSLLGGDRVIELYTVIRWHPIQGD